MTTRIPPLLEPYLQIPSSSSQQIILLTSVLGASTNWLVLRFLYDALGTHPSSTRPGRNRGANEGDGGDGGDGERMGREGEEMIGVVLVSFMRDFEFWREGGRKLGLDLSRLAQKGRFAFVDGLTGLFAASSSLPPAEAGKEDETGAAGAMAMTLRSPALERVKKDILQQVERIRGKDGVEGMAEGKGKARRVLLIIDQPDLLLAATGDEVGAEEMNDVIYDLREVNPPHPTSSSASYTDTPSHSQHTYATILTLSADQPLLLSPSTPLEINHASFLIGIAHQARFTIALRLLDTGAARDVSGVLRVTVGAVGWGGDDAQEDGDENGDIYGGKGREGEREERELLYFVGGDGGVRVFERGQ
ncbi:MAG: hypothetical protein M1827_007392 [Pycnora praestabilis]|nr:MAG: hypothetical protein M1827_007392 [Pycnora praestabilis]